MYRLAMPAAALGPYIESYWSVYATAEAPLDLTVDVFVDARADLVFTFGAPYRRSRAGGPIQVIDRSNLDAQRLYPIQIAQRGDVLIAGVRFHAGGLAPFVGGAVHDWNDRIIDVVDVFGPDVKALDLGLRTASASIDAQKEILDAFFTDRLRITDSYRTFHAMKVEIETLHGDVRMDALCERADVSQRQMDRLFRAHLGFSPKTYARVARFQRALNLLKKDPGCTLADVAARCGYYDQPHFVREFKAYAGTVPKTRVGYFPTDAPADFAPNLVQFVQDRGDE